MIVHLVNIFLFLIIILLEFFSFSRLIVFGYLVFVLLFLTVEVIVNAQKRKSAKKMAIELDSLENEVIFSPDNVTLFTGIAKFIDNKFSPRFIGFVTVNNSSFSVQYYSEKAYSNNLFFELLDQRKSNSNVDELIFHSNKAFSFPFYKKDNIEGYVFIGRKMNKARYTDKEVRYVKPLTRIIGKVLVLQDVGRYQKEKNQLQSAFSRYISPEVVNNILHNPEILHIGGEKHELSVIFTDLQGFTQIADSMDPVNLVRVLNIYLNEMSEVIIALGGTIDKFEGDAIMAFFGAPTPLQDHAIRCCKAALRMKKMERIINNQLLSANLISEPLCTRMGINTGDMIVGNVGSLKRIDYTIIGSNVNIASRLESANKDFDTTILVSEQTYQIVKDYFEFKAIGSTQLRGISRPIAVYELIDEKTEEFQESTGSYSELEVYEDVEVLDDVEELEEI